MRKLYQDKSVYDAAVERFDYIYTQIGRAHV